MKGFQIPDGFIDVANTEFRCPKCGNVYQDLDYKFLNRCEKNKSGITKVHCSCGCIFYVTYNWRGEAVSFKNDKAKLRKTAKT